MDDLAAQLWSEIEQDEERSSKERKQRAFDLLAALETPWARQFPTLSEARLETQERSLLPKGTVCPCCIRPFHTRKTSIHAIGAWALISLLRHCLYNGGEPVPVDKFHPRRTEIADCRHWGLVTVADNDNPDKNSSGLYLPTQHLHSWIRDDIRIPRYCRLHKNKVIGFEGNMMSFMFAAKKAFSYAELLAQRDIMEKHYRWSDDGFSIVGTPRKTAFMPCPRTREKKRG
jgi:hypothetical protein